MKQTVVYLTFIVLSIIGLADSGYVTYEKLSGKTPACTPGFNCEAVLNSPYASIAGIPISAFGMLFYGFIFVVSVSEYLGKPVFKNLIGKNHDSDQRGILWLASLASFIFTMYLVLVMAFVLEAWCTFCLISAITTTTIFLTSSWYVASHNQSSFFLKQPLYKLISFKYQHILKPIFFQFDPEFIHNSITKTGNIMGQWAVTRQFARTFFGFSHPVLRKNIAGIQLQNPIGLAAGFDYNGELTQILPDVGFGWHTIGTVTLLPYEGNKKPRLGRFPNSKSLLVNKGLKSLGAHQIIANLEHKHFRIPTGISIASTNTLFSSTKEQMLDFLTTFVLFEKSKVQHAYYELNISCPNTFGGEPFTSPDRLELLLQALDEVHISRPIFIKMPIDQSWEETQALLDVASRHDISGVIFGNLTKDHSNPDVHPDDAKEWATKKGNLSGMPTFRRSTQHIKNTRKEYGSRFVIIGTGGIFDAQTAQEKIDAGADALQLITGMVFNGPHTIGNINAALANKLLNNRTDNVR